MRSTACLLLMTVATFGADEKAEDAKIKLARVTAQTLAAACEQYYVKHSVYPPSLETLTETQPDGGAAYFAPSKLLDPWKKPYQYDPLGTRNGGLRPDVWTTTPKGVDIGNWPETDRAAWRVLGHDRGKVAILDSKGKVEWEFDSKCDGHDIALLPSGNVLCALGPATVGEVGRDKKVVWKYESKPKEGYKGRVEVHAFQRLDKGVTMIAESGNRRIVEVDRDGKIVAEVPLTVDKPDAHRDTRMARKLPTGNYLVCHEGDGKVREYDPKGKVVWSYTLDLAGRKRAPGHGTEGHGTEVFGAVRLASGNTLIGGGNNNRVIEVDPKGKIVWSIGHDELPGIKLAWVTTVQALPGGNVLVGNCHAGTENPQLFEVTREKKVVWQFKDLKTFGNGLAVTEVIGVKGKVIR